MSEPTDPRDLLMAALSATEQVIAKLNVAPPVVTLQRFEYADDTYVGLDLYFSNGPEGVAGFAEALAVTLTERTTADGKLSVSADAKVNGHDVRAWWLGQPVAASVSLPAEWSASKQ